MALRGALPAFPLDEILQLLAATEKTGVLEVRGGEEAGTLEVTRGRLTSARCGDDRGEVALGPIFAIERGDFEFRALEATAEPDLHGDLDEILSAAAAQTERVRAVRAVIPHDRLRFALSGRAAERGEIRLEPDEWKVLLAVDGRRDVGEVAQRLGITRLAAASHLADLVSAGMIDPVEPPDAAAEPAAPETPAAYVRLLPPMPPLAPTIAGEPTELTGILPDFPLETILQLLAVTKKTGRLEVRGGPDGYVLGMDRGRLVSAAWGDEAGELALGAAFTVGAGDFSYVPMPVAPVADLEGDLDELLDRAVATRDRIAANRALIPSERVRFRLSERAAQLQPQITLTPEQWRALLAVDGERDVALIAQQLRMRRLPTLVVLSDLVRGGLVDVLPAPEPGLEAAPVDRELTWPFVERRRAPSPGEAAEAPPGGEATTAPEGPPAAAEEPRVPAEAQPAQVGPLTGVPGEESTPEAAEVEEPLEQTPLDREPSSEDDRSAAISGLFGPADPVPPRAAWEPPAGDAEAAAADATAEAFALAPPLEAEPAVDPRLAAFGAPAAEPAAQGPEGAAPGWEPAPAPSDASPAWLPESAAPPAWEPAPAEPAQQDWGAAAPAWGSRVEGGPAEAEPAAEEGADVDPRLAAFGALPPAEAPPEAEPEPAEELAWPEPSYTRAEPAEHPLPEMAPLEEAPSAPAPAKKRGGLFGLFGGKQPARAAVTRTSLARTSAGRLALFANELIDSYNSGRYGKARVEDRMIGLLMRVDEQADPIDRPIPVVNDRIDIASVDEGTLPEEQAAPYLAALVRQIYDDAERVLGKDKARRGFRDARDRLFGRDLSVLRAPLVAGRMPKV